MIMEHTLDEYCNMLLTLRTCSRAGTATREYALRYPGRRRPDANAFQRMQQRLYEALFSMCGTHELGRSRTPSNRNP
jgi:hypothetical protein